VASESDWTSYDRAVVDLALPGRPPVRLAPDRPGQVGPWPDGLAVPVIVVTAWNPDSDLRPEADNRAAHEVLTAGLDRRGLPHWPAIGRDPGARYHEEGVAVPGLSEEEGTALGRSHGQAAVYVWTPGAWEVVSCTDDRRHVHGWRVTTLGDGAGAGAPATPSA
jgi:hypothetical protein